MVQSPRDLVTGYLRNAAVSGQSRLTQFDPEPYQGVARDAKKMTKSRDHSQRPSSKLPIANKVLAGCFIDFEGFAGNEHQTSPPPVLLGVFNQDESGEFKQIVFTSEYRWAANDPGVDHEVIFNPNRDQFLRDLVGSLRKSKPLFAFSEHELNVIRKHVGFDISERYRNVRAVAKKWLNKRGEDYPKPKSYCLRDMAEARGLSIDSKLQSGSASGRERV